MHATASIKMLSLQKSICRTDGPIQNSDRNRDCSTDMSVGYGLDSDDEAERQADYRAVRGLE